MKTSKKAEMPAEDAEQMAEDMEVEKLRAHPFVLGLKADIAKLESRVAQAEKHTNDAFQTIRTLQGDVQRHQTQRDMLRADNDALIRSLSAIVRDRDLSTGRATLVADREDGLQTWLKKEMPS